MTKFNMLKIHLSSLRNNIDYSAQIEKKERLLAKKIILPQTIKDTIIGLKNPVEKSGSTGESSNRDAAHYWKTRRKHL